jgi:hypothetical protein
MLRQVATVQANNQPYTLGRIFGILAIYSRELYALN